MQRFKIQFNQPLEAESQYCRQFVYDVAEFSSQYGREDAKSYTVGNLKSSPSIFPNYGDYLESCVLVRLLIVDIFENAYLNCHNIILEDIWTLVVRFAF